MSDQIIKRRELLDLAHSAGFSWGGDSGKELRTTSFDGEAELAELVRLVAVRLADTTRAAVISDLAGDFDPDAVFAKHRVGTFPEQNAAAKQIYAMGVVTGMDSGLEQAALYCDNNDASGATMKDAAKALRESKYLTQHESA